MRRILAGLLLALSLGLLLPAFMPAASYAGRGDADGYGMASRGD